MSDDGCITDPLPRRRRGQVVVLVMVLLLAMAYSLALLWLNVSPQLTIAVLGTVAAVTVRLCRSLSNGSTRGVTPPAAE